MGKKTSEGLADPHLCPISHHPDRNQGQPRSVQNQEHQHGMGRRVLLGIQLLQLSHRLQSQWSSSIVQPQHIGRNIHEHRPQSRMPFGNSREKSGKQRTDPTRQNSDYPTPLPYFHKSEPQRKNTCQTQRNIERATSRGKRSIHNIGPDSRVSIYESLYHRHHKGNNEKCDPNVIENHAETVFKLSF